MSDDFQFVLFMKQCRTFTCDIHLVRMFYSTQNYGSDTFCLMRCLLNQFSYLSKFPTWKDFFQTQQEKKRKKEKRKKNTTRILSQLHFFLLTHAYLHVLISVFFNCVIYIHTGLTAKRYWFISKPCLIYT